MGFVITNQNKIKMKKILIIDDTQANLDAAKLFFSKISSYEFLYATNRKDAEKYLEEAYAVITDRQMPSKANVELLDCDIPEEKMTIAKNVSEANGYHLLYTVYLSGKPVVMATEHSALAICLPNITVPTEKQYKGDPKDFSLEALLLLINENPNFDSYHSLYRYGNFGGVKNLGWNEGVLKTQERAWKMIWEELIKLF